MAFRRAQRRAVALVAGTLGAIACSSSGGPAAGGADAGGAFDATSDAAVDIPEAGDGDRGGDARADTGPPNDTACDALVSYWPAEASPADVTGLHPLSWRPDVNAKRYVAGKFGVAFGFPATPVTYLENQTVDALANTDTLTVAAWWNLSSTQGGDMFSIAAGAVPSLKMSIDGYGASVTVSIAGEADVKSAAITSSGGTFSHVAIALQKAAGGSVIRFYLNGEPLGVPANLAVPVPVGKFQAGSVLQLGWFPGALDEIMLFRRALADSEVKSLYQRGIACGPALQPPDAGTEFLRCSAPSPEAQIRCGSSGSTPHICASGNICCNAGSVGSCLASPAACASAGGTVGLACVKGECGSGSACCLANVPESTLSSVSCAKVSGIPGTSTCKGACDPTKEVQLCATTTDCPAGKKCTGFIALSPGGGDYPLGACLR